mgnify:CR=1 FL=1
MSNETNGLLFAGDLLVSIKNPATGVFSGYQALHADKFEIKTPSDQMQKISKGRETFGQSWLTYYTGKPAEFSCTLDELSRETLALQLSGEVTTLNQTVGAITAIDVTVVPGMWVDIGFENLDLAALSVTHSSGTPVYVKDVDYKVNERAGMIYVPVGGTIVAGIVKFTAGKKAATGQQVLGGKRFSTVMKVKLDGINLINRENMLLVAQQVTVSSEDAFDFLSGKLNSIPLKGVMEVAAGYDSPFQLKYYG